MSDRSIRVYDTQHDNPSPWDEVHKLLELNNVGNDSWHAWTVDGEEQGGGYLTPEDEIEVNNWLKSLGAAPEERVLIYHWW